jgi:hypothetical protein
VAEELLHSADVLAGGSQASSAAVAAPSSEGEVYVVIFGASQGCRLSGGFLIFLDGHASASPVEDCNQVVDAALQRFGKSQDHCQAGHFHAAFELTDEWVVRSAEIRECGLGQAAFCAQLAEALAEHDAFRLRAGRHARLSLVL